MTTKDWTGRIACPTHLVGALLAGLALRLLFVVCRPFEAGDTRIYDQLAQNWLDRSIYGLFVGGALVPVDIRVPGYPAFLAAIYAVLGRTRLAVMLAQTVVDLSTCVLVTLLAGQLARRSSKSSGGSRCRVQAAALWLGALCPFLANYAAVLLTEVLATFLTAAALLALLLAWKRDAPESGELGDSQSDGSPPLPRLHSGGLRRAGPPWIWLAAGIVAGLGALVRPETPLLLAAAGLWLGVRWRRVRDWKKLARAGLALLTGLVVPLLPWAARNWHSLHRLQFLAPRYAEMPGEFVPRGFYSWTKTWLVRFRDVHLVLWKLEEEPIRVEDLPASAFDSEAEHARVARLLERYTQEGDISPALDAEFAALARQRAAGHPLRTYLWIPFQRVLTMWFTPRVELLPFSGRPWPPSEKWKQDSADFLASLGFGLLNIFYFGLALGGAWRCRRSPGMALLVAFVLLRSVYLTGIETPEPRYVLPCFPAILALAAQMWWRTPGER
jgi:4-amino-4-deoxy-L-arabinose transferase-like glycosyltransferase